MKVLKALLDAKSPVIIRAQAKLLDVIMLNEYAGLFAKCVLSQFILSAI